MRLHLTKETHLQRRETTLRKPVSARAERTRQDPRTSNAEGARRETRKETTCFYHPAGVSIQVPSEPEKRRNASAVAYLVHGGFHAALSSAFLLPDIHDRPQGPGQTKRERRYRTEGESRLLRASICGEKCRRQPLP